MTLSPKMITNTRAYWILIVREEGIWAQEFGDYVKSVVVQERQDYLDSRLDFKARDVRIVCCMNTDEDILRVVREFNKKAIV